MSSWQTVNAVVETTDSVDAAFGDTLDFVAESLEGVNTEEMQVGLEDRVVVIKAQISETVVAGNNTLRLGRAGLLLLFLWLSLSSCEAPSVGMRRSQPALSDPPPMLLRRAALTLPDKMVLRN